ncbi:hypothetical protein [Hyalangium minutum]|uniref:hypothetical protein n=1 Tax=Hyalangium minutum TaxID=394096 RepID=UPI0005C6959B|nr:hypothetical protein [Hyalangium minutum]
MAAPFPVELMQAIAGADAVCAYVSKDGEPPALWYAVGAAKALKKPVVLVAANDRVTVPLVAQGEVLIALQKGEEETLEWKLHNALSRRRTRKDAPQRRLKPKGGSVPEAERIVTALARGDAVEGSRVEEAIEALLRKAGASMVQRQARDGDLDIDLAAWFDATQSILGNPILVEVKRVTTRDDLVAAQHQMMLLLARRPLGSGLLVYYPSMPDVVPEVTAHLPISVTLSFDDLVKLVRSGTLLETLIQLRNAAAHGHR